MRRLVAAVVVLLASTSLRADETAGEAKKRVTEEAKRVWRAFGDGVAPAPDVGKEARRVLEEHAKGIPVAERAAARIYVDEVDVMLAKAAWAAGDHAAARERAERVLESLRGRKADWDVGNVVHEMHILLGRVALETGDLERADTHLLQAARAPSSPQLASFGPDWTLARDLLSRGRREAVTKYVAGVGTFWESGRDQLAEWSKTLAAGGAPKFLPDRKPAEPQAKREKRDIGEPPALATPDGLVGFWESVGRSRGGIGGAFEFGPDDTVRTHTLILVDLRYRVESDKLFTDDGDGDPDGVPLGAIGGDTWTIPLEAEGAKPGKLEKKRVGATLPGAPPIVGVWTYDHRVGMGAKAFERYDTDGWLRFRMFMPGIPDRGTFDRRGDALRMTFRGKTQDHVVTITGDRMRLAGDGKEYEYRYVGKRAWYMPEAKDKPEEKTK
jgi:hypothetical protein